MLYNRCAKNKVKIFSFILVWVLHYSIIARIFTLSNNKSRKAQNHSAMTTVPTLLENEYFRVNSYYWQGMVYIAIETAGDKTLCKIKGSTAKPKWIKTAHLSKTYKQF